MMKIPKKVLGVCAVAVLAGISLLAGLRQSPAQKYSLWIDPARPVSIEPPMEVVEIGEHGELGLWLPAEVGRGWKGEANGEAAYQFYAPERGSYTVWAYCLWHDECTNAVYAQFDEAKKAILGNDPVFNEWHWVKGFDVPLEKGFHRLRLSNHSANIAIQRVFLTTDPLQVPPNADAALATLLFSDDFNGCDRGNFPMWRKASGKWETRHPADRKTAADNVLTGTSDGSALITYGKDTWRGIRLTVSVFCDSPPAPDASVGVCFSVADEGDDQEITLTPSSDGQEVLVRHIRHKSRAAETLAEGRLPWRQASWHELQLDLSGPRPVLVLDGGARFVGGPGSPVGGGIGLALHGRLTASFDNVLVQSVESGG